MKLWVFQQTFFTCGWKYVILFDIKKAKVCHHHKQVNLSVIHVSDQVEVMLHLQIPCSSIIIHTMHACYTYRTVLSYKHTVYTHTHNLPTLHKTGTHTVLVYHTNLHALCACVYQGEHNVNDIDPWKGHVANLENNHYCLVLIAPYIWTLSAFKLSLFSWRWEEVVL